MANVYNLSSMVNCRQLLGRQVATLLILAACDLPLPWGETATSTAGEGSTSHDTGANTASDESDTTRGSDSSDPSTGSEGIANRSPQATDDVYLVRQGESLLVQASDGVLSNDIDLDEDSLTASIDDGTALVGTVRLEANGLFEYTPPAHAFWGEETFTYTVEDGQGGIDTGRVRVVVRPVAVPLAAVVAGVGGFAIDGEAINNRSGRSLSHAGDVNGDGFADLIVGAGYASPNGVPAAGRSYVVFGKTDGQRVALSQLTGSQGFVIDGEERGHFAGRAVSGAGDVNGDGLADVIVGAPFASPNGLDYAGRSYVVFGKSDGAPVALADIAAATETLGFAMDGATFGSYAGDAVSRAGDVNGDGLADVIVGANREGAPNFTSYVGRSYVVFGKADASPVTLSELFTDSDRGFSMLGEDRYDYSGRAVSGSGDVNGDGFDDVIISAGSQYSYSGERSYVIFGKATGTPVDLTAVASEQGGGFVINIGSAFSVSVAGDINGDGLADLAIGSRIPPRFDPTFDVDDSFVIFGKSDSESVELEDLQNGGGFVIDGAGERPGANINGAGDVNGDGLTDLIVGFPNANPNGVNQAGRTYVIYGKTDATTVQVSDIAAGEGGFVLNGEFAVDLSGSEVSSAGDVNADGFGDLIVGAALADPNGITSSGRSYVIFGGDFTLSATPSP